MANPSIVHTATSARLTTSGSLTITAPTNGNYLYVIFYGANGTTGLASLSLTGVASWTKQATYYETTNGTASIEVWSGLVGSGAGTSITATATTTGQTFCFHVIEAANTTGTIDKSANATGSGTTLSSGTTAATTYPNELWIACIAQGAVAVGVTVGTPTNSYTQQAQGNDQGTGGSVAICTTCTYIASASGTAGCSLTSSASSSYAGLSVSIPGTSQPIALINSAQNTAAPGTSGTLTITVTAPTSGNVLILNLLGLTSGVLGTPSLTGVTWTLITSQTLGTNYTIYSYYGIASGTTGTSLTVAISSWTSGATAIGQVSEFSGVSTTSPVDVYTSNAQTSSTTTSYVLTTNSVTPTHATDAVVAFMAVANGPGFSLSGGPANSFTAINHELTTGTTALGTQFAYQVESATSSYSTGQTFNSPVSALTYGSSIVLGLTPSGSGGGTARRRFFMIYD